jgi:excisionase family DNA binding protein
MPEYLTSGEVATLTRRSPWTVRKWGRRGVLPVVRPVGNGPMLFRRRDVEKMLAAADTRPEENRADGLPDD